MPALRWVSIPAVPPRFDKLRMVPTRDFAIDLAAADQREDGRGMVWRGIQSEEIIRLGGMVRGLEQSGDLIAPWPRCRFPPVEASTRNRSRQRKFSESCQERGLCRDGLRFVRPSVSPRVAGKWHRDALRLFVRNSGREQVRRGGHEPCAGACAATGRILKDVNRLLAPGGFCISPYRISTAGRDAC